MSNFCNCEDAEDTHEHCVSCDCVLKYDEDENYCASCVDLNMKRKYQTAFKAAADASPEVRALGYQRWVRILRTWIEVTDNANSNTNNRRILD